MPDAFLPSFFTLSASLLLMTSCLKQYANKSSKVTEDTRGTYPGFTELLFLQS